MQRSKSARYESAVMRQGYVNQWKVDLCHTPIRQCPFFCLAVFCGPCVSYKIRQRVLYNDMSRYVCCGGFCPCSGKMKEQECPECCLCLEVWCCFAQSVASSRFMIQDELRVQTSKCDNCIIGTMVFFQYLACVCHIVACLTNVSEIDDLAQLVDCIADALYISVCACMQTQHKVELDYRDGKLAPQAGVQVAAPTGQQMVRPPGNYHN
eukprot:jgi/Mesvir1/5975/Mv00729-RA.1